MGFHKWGTPHSWMVKKIENPIYKWMMTGGSPILGNPHIETYCSASPWDAWTYHSFSGSQALRGRLVAARIDPSALEAFSIQVTNECSKQRRKLENVHQWVSPLKTSQATVYIAIPQWVTNSQPLVLYELFFFLFSHKFWHDFHEFQEGHATQC